MKAFLVSLLIAICVLPIGRTSLSKTLLNDCIEGVCINGQGTILYPNGDIYVGQFKGGAPHGKGTKTWANGTKYVGEFKDGKYHGQGTLTHPDGRKCVGKFKNGEFVEK